TFCAGASKEQSNRPPKRDRARRPIAHPLSERMSGIVSGPDARVLAESFFGAGGRRAGACALVAPATFHNFCRKLSKSRLGLCGKPDRWIARPRSPHHLAARQVARSPPTLRPA